MICNIARNDDLYPAQASQPYRILVVDDKAAIHDDFDKILQPTGSDAEVELDDLSAVMFGGEAVEPAHAEFALDHASQGEHAIELVRRAISAGRPYATVFLDVRMPPGIDGIETARRLWQLSPELQVVICTAFSDYSWEEMAERLGRNERWVVLKKPFDPIEVRQIAHALTRKWTLTRLAREREAELEAKVQLRTRRLDAANAALQREIAERRRAESALVLAQKMEAVGRLATGVGHEINNPLAFIYGNIEFVVSEIAAVNDAIAGRPLDAALEALRDVEAGTMRIRRVVEDLRKFVRSEPSESHEVDVTASLEVALSMVARPFETAGVACTVEAEPLPTLHADSSRVEQVFVNILMNAADAMADGQTDRRVTCRLGRRGATHIVASFRDNGIGIPAEDLPRIFDPFFTTRPGVGTGLGLSISYRLVCTYGGEIEVESEPGHGTEVRVVLPIDPPAHD